MITYNDTIELYHPELGTCLPRIHMPDNRRKHSQCGSLLCGGIETNTSCMAVGEIAVSPPRISMVEERVSHLCWTLPGGEGEVMLLGGNSKGEGRTTETVSRLDWSSEPGFQLQNQT